MDFAINTGASALKAFGTKMAVSANNVANAYSDDFEKSRALVTEGRNDAVKVEISTVDTEGAVETRMVDGEVVEKGLSNTWKRGREIQPKTSFKNQPQGLADANLRI